MTQSQKGYSELRNSIDNGLFEGTEFVLGESSIGVADATNVNLLLENPSDSGRTLVTRSPSVRAGKRVNVRLDFNPTVDTAGEPSNVKSRRSDIENGSVANGYFGGTYTLTEPFEVIPVGETPGDNNTYGSSRNDAAFAIAPGDTALLQATTTATDTDVRVSFDFTELPDTVLQ